MKDRIVALYQDMPHHKKIVFWVAVAVFALSVFRICFWVSTRSAEPTVGAYLKKIRAAGKQEKLDALYVAGLYKKQKMLPAIEQVFESEKDADVRDMAAWAIGRMDAAKVIAWLDGSDKEKKLIAADALMKLDPENVSLLADRILTAEPDLREKIFAYLALRKDSRYQEKLLGYAEDAKQDIELRKACLNLLKEIGTTAIESRLMALYYNDPETDIRKLAREVRDAISKRGT